MQPDWIKVLLDMLTQFTGGRGGIDHTVVNYGIAAIFYSVLLTVARTKNRNNDQPRERLLMWGFGIGLSRELFMIGMAAVQALGLVDPVVLHEIFPPLEHALLYVAMILIAGGYLGYFLETPAFTRRYLQAGIASIVLTYVATFWWWANYIEANPTSKFGKVWCDWLFHIDASFWLFLAAIYVFKNAQLRTRNLVTLALFLFAVSEFLKLPDMALDEAYEFVFAPISRVIYLSAIFMLGYVYILEEISKRNLILIALNDSEERLRLALDAAHMGTFDWDIPNDRITWSRWHEELWGFQPGEFDNTFTAFSQRVHPDDLAGINAEVTRCIAEREPFVREYRVVWPDGSIHWIVGRGEFVFGADGQPQRMRGAVLENTERVQAEAALRRHAETLEWAHVLIRDMDNNIISWNKGAEQLYGWLKEEAIGKVSHQLFNTRFPLSQEAYEAELFKNGVWEGVLQHTKRDGTPLWAISHQVVHKDGQGRPVAILEVNTDITERKRAEDALREREQELDAIVENLPLMVFAKDAQQLRFVRINRAGEDMLGVPRTELLGKSDHDFFPPDQAEFFTAKDRETLASTETLDIPEEPIDTRHGRRLLHTRKVVVRDAVGQPRYLLGISEDITARKQQETALKLSEERYRSIFDSMFEGFCIIEMLFDEQGLPSDYRFLETNPVFESQTGLKNARGKLMRELAPEHESHWFEIYGKVALTGESVHFENEARALNRWYEVSAYRVGGQGSCKVGILFNDISERNRTRLALQSSLNEKTALLNEVHHRVKNNLQVITSLLRLESGRSMQPEIKAVLSDMQGRIRAMALLHETLYRSGSFAAVDMGNYLKQLATQTFRALLTDSDAVQLHLDLASVNVSMDQAAPCGLLVNELISNSLKHGFPDGRTGEVRIELSEWGSGSQVRLRVSDNGVGLPHDFEAKRVSSLGLQLVTSLAVQLGGALKIESGSGPGAVFVVIFKVDDPRTAVVDSV